MLKIKRGYEVHFDIEDEKVIIKKSQRKVNFNKYIGYLKDQKDKKSDDIMKRLREGA
ncbi:MAG: hypothetical protein JW956_02745 [Calditrichaceae bacterium]|nr:hypothetical protein [Calditrichaceae bacterium]